MKKNFKTRLLLMASAFVLFAGGCSSQIAEMTPEQQEQVGEYAAFAMLRYDAEHRSRLVDYSEVEAADEKIRLAAEAAAAAEAARALETGEEADKPEGTYDADGNLIDVIDKSEEGNGYTSDTMEDFLGLSSGMLLTYKGYTVQSSYPEESDVSEYFAVDATPGKKFLVLWYSLYNGSGSDQDINFLSDDVAMRARVNDDINVTALVTMLNDDMSTLQTHIRDNEEIECVLVYEISEEAASDIRSIVVRLSKSGHDWERKVL